MDRGMKKLLLVGENALRDDLKSTIGGDDIQMLTAASGEAALSLLENERVDAIVLDAKLQDMGVQNFVQEVHKKAKPPIVLYDDKTNNGDEAELIEVSESGIIRQASSLERLLDETVLLLHRPASALSEAQLHGPAGMRQ